VKRHEDGVLNTEWLLYGYRVMGRGWLCEIKRKIV